MKKNKFLSFMTFIISLAGIVAGGYLIYNILLLKNIENTIRYIAIGAIGLITLILIIIAIKSLKKSKKGKLIFVLILIVILVGGEVFASYNIGKVYSSLAKVSNNSSYVTKSSSLVTLKENDVNDLKDVKSTDTLGILSDTNSYEGYIIPKEIIKKNNLDNKTEKYTSYVSMLKDLYDGKINYVFMPSNYAVMPIITDVYPKVNDETKIIYTGKKKVKNESTSKSSKKVTEPFTLLLMGVDSDKEGIEGSTFNGDSLMLLTFNPKTLSTTILSIPRDSYVPIMCFPNHRKNKITHAASYGEDCMQKTIENFLDVDIDYYVKINFKGVVKLVDILGGVDIDVPYNLCEQNSSRQWGSNTIYIEKGQQKLNGEQALAYARNRHPNPGMCSSKWTNYTSSDFVRGQHQQEIVKALLNKVKTINSLDTIYNLLDAISNNMETNMSTDQILDLYNVFKDISNNSDGSEDMSDLLGMQRLYLNGHDARIYDYGGMNLSLYNYVLYDNSIKAVSNAMKENLGLKTSKESKKLTFDINDPYEETVIGKDETGGGSVTLLPSFIGSSYSYVQSYASRNGFNVTSTGGSGSVISQNVPAGTNVEDIRTLTVRLSGGSSTKSNSTRQNSSSKTPSTYSNKDKAEGNGTTGGTKSGSDTVTGSTEENNDSNGSTSPKGPNSPNTDPSTEKVG